MKHDDPWTEDLEVLDDEARAVLAFLQRLGEPPFVGVIDGPIYARVDAYGVITTTVTGPAGELYLQASDGWNRAIWRQPPNPPCEWTWQTATTPALAQALLGGLAHERRVLLGRRMLATQYLYRDEAGEEQRVDCRRPPLLARPLAALAVRAGLTSTVDLPPTAASLRARQ